MQIFIVFFSFLWIYLGKNLKFQEKLAIHFITFNAFCGAGFVLLLTVEWLDWLENFFLHFSCLRKFHQKRSNNKGFSAKGIKRNCTTCKSDWNCALASTLFPFNTEVNEKVKVFWKHLPKKYIVFFGLSFFFCVRFAVLYVDNCFVHKIPSKTLFVRCDQQTSCIKTVQLFPCNIR